MKRFDLLALHLNNLRVVPRIVLLWLMHTTWMLAHWAMHLARPVTAEDVALVGLFTGLFVAAFKFYVDTGSFQRTDDKEEQHG